MERHFQVGAGLHPDPFDEGAEPWVNPDGSEDHDLRECYRVNRPAILQRYVEGPVDSTYNIPMYPGMTMSDINAALREIYQRQHHAFKINLSFGFIMRNVETGQYRYFRPYANVNILDVPISISGRADLVKVLKKLKELDIFKSLAKNRPDTKWRLVLLTNIRVTTYNTNYALGAAKTSELPEYIRRSKHIISLDKDPVLKRSYTDHLCLFRCLSLHRNGTANDVDDLVDLWRHRYTEREYQELLGNDVPASDFDGVQLSELPEFERLFEINVNMYSLEEDGVVLSVFKSTERYDDTMVVNLYENHCSYVTNFSQYAKKFKCALCDRLFDDNYNFKRHANICDRKTLFRYPGGFYRPSRTVFQELGEFGVVVPEDERTFPWFAVFDFESMLVKLENDATEKLEWTHEHVPISVSVCSNVPGHTEPRCFVDVDTDVLLTSMVQALTEMQTSAAELAERKWAPYFDQLKDVLRQCDDDEEDGAERKSQVESMYGRFRGYATALPVLGFNR